MRRLARWLAVLGFGLGIIGSAGPVAAARPPVVVELFTAQGCSSCVDTGSLINSLQADPRVIALTFGVDYWDYLGWADTFAQGEFTQRQRAYMKNFAKREVYTPQLVIAGAAQAAASPLAPVQALIKKAERAPRDPPDIVFRDGSRVLVGSGRGGRPAADVWLVRYDPGEQKVQVKAGDNRGRTVLERNVVRQLVRLGSWSGRSKAYKLPPIDTPGLKSVIILQAPDGGRIIAAKQAGAST